MKVTKRDIKRIAIISTVASLVFLFISIVTLFSSPTLDYMVVIALAAAVTPAAIASIIHNKWKNKVEAATPEFMRDLATASKTGMPLQTALEHASKRQYGPLTTELKMLVANMSWGMNFNEALTQFSKRIDLSVITKATTLILESGRTGGNLADIFESTKKIRRKRKRLDQKKK